ARLAPHLQDARPARGRPHAGVAPLGRARPRASHRAGGAALPAHRERRHQGEDRVRTPRAVRPSRHRSSRRAHPPAPPPPPPPRPRAGPAPAAPPAGGQLDISDFAKLELRAARVVAAEKIAGARKLLRLEVDLGDEKRQIVAGIADAYSPESLLGKTI